MRRKIICITLCLIVLCTTCKRSDISVNNISNLPNIDNKAIAKAIQQSVMDDEGYRFATAELESQFSSYATYYIRMSKEYAGISQRPITIETKNKIIEKSLNSPNLNLTDIFCTISLLENCKDLPMETKEKISSYFNSLYDENIKGYVLHNSSKNDDPLSNVYTNYLVYTTANHLDITIFSIVDWLEKAIQYIYSTENITAENSSAYSMILELSKAYNLDIPQESIIAIIEMFENNLDNLQDLEKKGIYIPVFLMDYMDSCRTVGVDNSKNFQKII
ncbi:MAG: hypothetical protein ACK5LT_09280 [Lachnospirales bacterium]